MAWRGVSCVSGSDRLAGLTRRACYGVDIAGQGRAGGCCEQASRHQREKTFHGFLLEHAFQEGARVASARHEVQTRCGPSFVPRIAKGVGLLWAFAFGQGAAL